MIDFLFSSLPPGKGVDHLESGLSGIMANIALVVGATFLRPAIEQHFYSAIGGQTPTGLDNRQFFKAVLDLRHLLSPALDGLSILHLLKVKPAKPTIATAVTVVKAVPTPVQIFQEESSFSAMLGIIACMIFALVGTVLAFQHYRQGASWSSPSGASSDNSDSSLEPYSYDSPPPNEGSSDDESSGSGDHPPPVPVFDLFYDLPILHLDKAVDTGDKQVRDEDGPPPPPPPSFPTPVEDGDPFKSMPFVFKWLSLILVMSIISFVINRFFKGYGKTPIEVSIPTTSKRIDVNEISGAVVNLFPSATPNPVININPTCRNLLPLVETEMESLSISTRVTSAMSHPSRKFIIVIFSLLFMSCLFGFPFIAQYFLDHHLQRTVNSFLPPPIPRRSLDEITDSTTSSVPSLPPPKIAPTTDDATDSDELNAITDDEETDDLPLVPTFALATDDAAGNDATGCDEDPDNLMKNSVQQELSFNNVGDNTLVTYEKASPLGVDLDDILDASEDGVPFLEVFRGLSISSSSSSDGIAVSNEKPESSTAPMFGLPTTGGDCAGYGKKVLSEHVFKSNIPVLAKKVQTVSAPARAYTLPICGAALLKNSTTSRKPSSMESLNPEAASFSPLSHVPVRRHSLRHCYSPPSPTRRGLSASIHAPQRRKSLSASMHASSSPSEEDFCDSIYVPRSPPRPNSSASVYALSSPPIPNLNASIHAPTSPPNRGLNTSIHAPTFPPRPDLSASVHASTSPPRLGLNASIHAPTISSRTDLNASVHASTSPPRLGLNASIHAPFTPPKRGLNASIHAPIQHEPMEPMPIPVVDLSPERRIRRVIDPQRQCDLVVLVSDGSVFSVSP